MLFLKSVLSALLLVLLGAFCSDSAQAQGTEKRIRFSGNQKTISCNGRIPSTPYDYDAYVFAGRAKQSIAVSLQSVDPTAYFVIYSLDRGPADDLIVSTKDSKAVQKQWKGRLPDRGTYSFQVYGKRKGAPYTLCLRRE